MFVQVIHQGSMTNNQVNFTAQKRDIVGKKTKKLRAQGLIPANIHGDIKESLSISVEKTPFVRLYNEVGDSSLIYLEVDGQKHPVLVDDIHTDPISDEFLHITFKQVNLKEEVTADVSIEIVGEPANKDGVLVQVLDVVPVRALPSDLPESLQVDISGMNEIGQHISISDLPLPKDVKIDLEEDNLSEPVVILQEKATEEEAESTPETDEVADAAEATETETSEA